MKLLCQLPAKLDLGDLGANSFIDVFKRVYSQVKRPDTDTVIRGLDRGLSTLEQVTFGSLRFLNEAEVLKAVIPAEEQGFDGVVIICVGDSGLRAAKSALNIPVVGAGESVMRFAATMGSKFAIVTSDVGLVPNLVENIDKYGVWTNLIGGNPVRAITLSETKLMGCLSGDYTPLVNDFTRVARGCIQDGAEVLVAGCGVLSIMLSDAGVREIDGVPVVDPEIIAFKTAEMLVDLHKAKVPIISRKGLYALTPREELARVKDIFRL